MRRKSPNRWLFLFRFQFLRQISRQGRGGEDVFISKGYLRKLFKERYGESPITHLLRKKLELAEEMLRMTDCPVKEIAEKVGIKNPYYFSALFRRKKGLSPAKYRLVHGAGKETP